MTADEHGVPLDESFDTERRSAGFSGPHRPAVKHAIFGAAKNRRHGEPGTVRAARLDRDQAAIQQSVEVSPEQQAIGGVVRFLTKVGVDVRGLEHVEHGAAGRRAAAAVGGDQFTPEICLAAPFLDGVHDLPSGLLDISRQEWLVISVPRIDRRRRMGGGDVLVAIDDDLDILTLQRSSALSSGTH